MTTTNTNELIIYYRKYGEDLWFRVDGDITKGGMPSGDDPAESKLYDFTATFHDPQDYDDTYFSMTNGDDIAVVETTELLAIVDGIKCGVITKTQCRPRGRIDNRWSREFAVNIENRDFSVHPFTMGIQSFADQAISQDLDDVLQVIFYGTDENGVCNTRDDLGGILSDGTVIDKYDLISDSTEVIIIDTILGARETLNEYLNPAGYAWRSIYYLVPDSTNAIKTIQQVQIWKSAT